MARLIALLLIVCGLGLNGLTAQTAWTHDPATAGDWFDLANWSAGLPDLYHDAYISNGGTADMGAGTVSAGTIWLGYDALGSGGMIQQGGLIDSRYLYIGYSGLGSFLQVNGNNTPAVLSLGAKSTGSGTFELRGGSLNPGSGSVYPGSMHVGDQGKGHFIQNGGSVGGNIADFVLGYQLGSEGTYDLNSGQLTNTFTQTIGWAGKGTFTQKSGLNSVGNAGISGTEQGEMRIGYLSAAQGKYVLQAGLTKAQTEKIGVLGAGEFQQESGQNLVAGNLQLGLAAGGSGTYRLLGGWVSALVEQIGMAGSGQFVQASGTNSADTITVGATGRYEQSGGLLQAKKTLTNLGLMDFSHGNGSISVSDNGLLDLAGGSILNAENTRVTVGLNSLVRIAPGFDPMTAFKSFTTGGVILTAGQTLYISPTATYHPNSDIQEAVLCEGTLNPAPKGTGFSLLSGVRVQGNGLVSTDATGWSGEIHVKNDTSGISGGTLKTSNLYVGYDGPGTFEQTGGLTDVGRLTIGKSDAENGQYLVKDGTLKAGMVELYAVTNAPTNRVVQSGGTVNATSLYLYAGARYQLDAGDLTVSSSSSVGGNKTDSAVFVQNGGRHTALNLYSGGTSRYELHGGQLTVGNAVVKNFRQDGGISTLQFLAISASGKYEWSGGELYVGGMDLAGDLDCKGQTQTLRAADGAWLDFTSFNPARLVNAQNISFASSANSLVIVPPGINPSLYFASYAHAGLTHVTGTPLVVPAEMHLQYGALFVYGVDRKDFPDHVQVVGSIRFPYVNTGLNLKSGVEVLAGGEMTAGSGILTCADQVSGNYGGHLKTLFVDIGNVAADCSFTQTGGLSELGYLNVASSQSTTGYKSYFTMSGGELNVTYGEHVGNVDSGIFTQSGGTHTFSTLTVNSSGSRAGNLSSYTLSGAGVMQGTTLRVGEFGPALFNQQSGTVNVSTLLVDYAPNSYNLIDGSLTAANETIKATLAQSGGAHYVTSWLNVDTAGNYQMTGGSLQAKAESVAGRFVQSPGTTHTVTGDLFVGKWALATFDLQGSVSAGSETIGDAYTRGLFRQSKGYNEVRGLLAVNSPPPSVNGNSNYELSGGDMLANAAAIRSSDAATTGWFNQSGGSFRVTTDLTIGKAVKSNGGYDLSGAGRLQAAREFIGSLGGNGDFTQHAGVNSAGELHIGPQGHYHLLGGELAAGWLDVDGLADLAGGSIRIASRLRFGAHAAMSGGTAIPLYMDGSAFENVSTSPEQLDLSSLQLIFQGGSGVTDSIEVAGQDLGATPDGLLRNFAFGTLQVGGGQVGQVRLVDALDNQPGWSGAETLYVTTLILGQGSSLDLNGLNLYCRDFVNLGGTILGGEVMQVPEPTCLLSSMLCAAAMILRPRRGHKRCRV